MNKPNKEEQRSLAVEVLKDFPDLVEVIKNEANCYQAIMEAAKRYRKEILDLWRDDFPQAWACYWAYYIGDRDIMRDRVTEPEWVLEWGWSIGDGEIMRSRLTDPAWIRKWEFCLESKEEIECALINKYIRYHEEGRE